MRIQELEAANDKKWSAAPPPPPGKVKALLPKLADLPKEAKERQRTKELI
jgi:hypothetical protein